MAKWLKVQLRIENPAIDYAVQLSACIFHFEDGRISRVIVNGIECTDVRDGSGHAHPISAWGCESLEEFELQAMLNNCIFGLSEDEESAVKAALDSCLMKKLKEAKEKACELSNACNKLMVEVDRQKECLHEVEDDVYNLFMSYWEKSDWDDPETMYSLMTDFAALIGLKGSESIDDWRYIPRKAWARLAKENIT